jgi:hypothetical protein
MFGWEFPPYISGGLGTACYGLTKSLTGLGVDVLFVLPRIKGTLENENLHLLDASTVELTELGSRRGRESLLKLIPIDSALRPYLNAAQYASYRRRIPNPLQAHSSSKGVLDISGDYGP